MSICSALHDWVNSQCAHCGKYEDPITEDFNPDYDWGTEE